MGLSDRGTTFEPFTQASNNNKHNSALYHSARSKNKALPAGKMSVGLPGGGVGVATWWTLDWKSAHKSALDRI